MLRKIKNVLVLTADLTPGFLLVTAGTAVIVGGSTGVLWH